jgi:hypothetical protein
MYDSVNLRATISIILGRENEVNLEQGIKAHIHFYIKLGELHIQNSI